MQCHSRRHAVGWHAPVPLLAVVAVAELDAVLAVGANGRVVAHWRVRVLAPLALLVPPLVALGTAGLGRNEAMGAGAGAVRGASKHARGRPREYSPVRVLALDTHVRGGVEPALHTHDLELDACAPGAVGLHPPDVAVAGVQEVKLACVRQAPGGGG